MSETRQELIERLASEYLDPPLLETLLDDAYDEIAAHAIRELLGDKPKSCSHCIRWYEPGLHKCILQGGAWNAYKTCPLPAGEKEGRKA